MSLPAFSGLDSTCPKCGVKGLGVRHLRDNRSTQYGSVAWKADPDIFPCMERRCRTCQFETLEAPLSVSDALTAPAPVAQADGDDDIAPALFVQWKHSADA